ncbi:MAG: hypothetical protein SF066_18270 [Thermoanaerobaculia bacterium]|nr:hypothetical protein [Thermoanaerobaculia bacterium]
MSLVREKVVQSAEKLVSRGKIESGIKEYRKLLEETPNDISTLNRVGDLYARINRNGEAIDLFSQIAQKYTADGFFVKAIAIYKKIIKLDPTRLDIYEELADLYHKQGLITEARTQYQVLADYYQKHDNATSAIAICKKLVRLEPNDPSHHAKLAEIYQRQRLNDKAIEEYKTIAELMLSHGHAEQAAQVYERALDIASEDIAFITGAVLKLKESGAVGAATRLLSAAVERNPKAERVARLVGGDRTGDTGVFPRPALTPPSAAPAPAPAPTKISEDDPLGDFPVGAFELEVDDTPATSLVAPPPDMAGPGAAFLRAGEAPTPTPPPPVAAPVPTPAVVPPPVAALAPTPAPEDEDFVFELDLDASASLLLSDVASVTDAQAAAEHFAPGLDHDLLERTAAEVEPSRALQVEDLLTEAEVLAKYGIEDKALERLDELLARDPTHLAGYRLAITLHLDRERHEIVSELATKMARLADKTLWPEVRDRLEGAGYRFVNGRMEPPRLGAGSAATAPASVGGLADFEPSLENPAPAVPGLDFGGRGPLDLQADLGPGEPPEAAAPARFELTPTPFSLDFDALELELAEPHPAPAAPAPVVEFSPVSAPDAGFELADESKVYELDLGGLDSPPEEVAEAPAEVLDFALDFELPPLAELSPEPPAAPSTALPVEPPPPAAPPKPAPPPPRKAPAGEVDDLLAQIRAGVLPRPTKPRAPAPTATALPPTAPIQAPPPSAVVLPPPVERPAAAAATAGEPVALDPLRALGQSLRMELDDDLADFTFPTSAAFAPPPTPSGPPPPLFGDPQAPAATLDDSGTSWLDEVSKVREAPKARLFENEKDFFDLGAELDQELSAEEQILGGPIFTGAEQSLEEIVEGFKKGVAENLSTEDFDTHYNLGIAYREMGLLDEAVGEFQLASKSPAYLVSCASMLGLCFLEKNLPELAVKWYRRGLEAPKISEEDQLGLLYDLGNAYLAAGDEENGYKIFVEAYGINSNYRDLVARLAELGPREH